MNHKLLREIPKVDELLKNDTLERLGSRIPGQIITQAGRQTLEELRKEILSGAVEEMPSVDDLCGRAAALAARNDQPSLRPVINGTGIILHTNLGRACISDRAAAAAQAVAQSYSTLESAAHF